MEKAKEDKSMLILSGETSKIEDITKAVEIFDDVRFTYISLTYRVLPQTMKEYRNPKFTNHFIGLEDYLYRNYNKNSDAIYIDNKGDLYIMKTSAKQVILIRKITKLGMELLSIRGTKIYNNIDTATTNIGLRILDFYSSVRKRRRIP